MDIRENIRIAIFSIKTNMMRSLLTMLGIIIGVSSVIAIITIGNGGRDYIVGMIKDMSSNAMQITVNVSGANDGDYLTQEDVNAISKLESVQYCSPFEFSFGNAEAGKKSGFVFTITGNQDILTINGMTTKYGRMWTKEEYDQRKRVCVVSTLTSEIYSAVKTV